MYEMNVVHEVPGRLRFRSALLADARLDASWLESWLEALAGVHSVRVNRPAQSIVVEYGGDESVRSAVIRRLEAFSLDKQPGTFPLENREAGKLPPWSRLPQPSRLCLS